jgi:hypothetical protein
MHSLCFRDFERVQSVLYILYSVTRTSPWTLSEMFEGSNLSKFRLQQDSNIESLYKYDCERNVMISIKQ